MIIVASPLDIIIPFYFVLLDVFFIIDGKIGSNIYQMIGMSILKLNDRHK